MTAFVKTCTALSLAASVAGFAAAASADEASFEDRVRDYLLKNPEVILEALEILSNRERRAELQKTISSYPELFSDPSQLGFGDLNAPIKVVEFFDYKCAPCKAVHPALVDFVAANPQVRLQMRQLPILTPGSERAARFALAVYALHGADTYAQAHAMLWETRGPLSHVAFRRISDALGLDFAALTEASESAEVTERITYNRDAAIALGVLGTPAFVTSGSVTFGTTDVDVLAETWGVPVMGSE